MAEQRQQLRDILKFFGVPADIVDRCKDEQLDALISQGYDSAGALKCASRDSLKEVLPGCLALVDAILAAEGGLGATVASVFARPLPHVSYERAEDPVSTSMYNSHPASVEVWPVDPAEVLSAAAQLPNNIVSTITQKERITVVFSSEAALKSRYLDAIEMMNIALSGSSSPALKVAYWMEEPSKLASFWQLEDAGAAAAEFRKQCGIKPDFELKGRRGQPSVCFMEVKRPELLEFVSMESLAEQWNRDQSSNTKSNVTCVVSQATSYASVAGIKYFVISTYEVTWLAQVLRPGVIAITRGFASEATCPSVLQALWFLTTKALSDEEPVQSWNPLPTPNFNPGKRGPKPKAKVKAKPKAKPKTPQATSQYGPDQDSEDGDGDHSSSSSSSSSSIAAAGAAGDMFNAFDVKGFLGRGMSGTVYRARLGGDDVAIKLSSDESIQPHLQHEACMYRHLERLQGTVIPRLVGHGWSPIGRGYWIATSLVPGSSLRSAGTWQQHRIEDLLHEGLSVLDAFHAAGALHGDIRPENIIVGSTPEGLLRITLLDLGFASLSDCPDQREAERCMLADTITRCAGTTESSAAGLGTNSYSSSPADAARQGSSPEYMKAAACASRPRSDVACSACIRVGPAPAASMLCRRALQQLPGILLGARRMSSRTGRSASTHGHGPRCRIVA